MKAMFQIVWFNTRDYIVPPTLGVLNKHAVLHSFPGLQLGLVRPPRGLLCWFTHTFQQHLSHAQFHWSNRKVIKLEVLIKVQFFFLCEVCLIKILSLSYTIKIHANTSAFAKLSQQYETHLSRWALCRPRHKSETALLLPHSPYNDTKQVHLCTSCLITRFIVFLFAMAPRFTRGISITL